MKRFTKILKFIFPKYWKNAVLNFVFVLLSVVFGLGSMAMAIPFLGILFDTQPAVTDPVAFDIKNLSESVVDNLNYFLSQIIVKEGKHQALIFVSIIIVFAVMFKTGFLYLGKFFMSPLRNGVVNDIRNKIYSKITKLQLSYFSDERKGDIISRTTNDVKEVEVSVIQSLDILYKDPITIVAYVTTLLVMSPQLTLFAFILLPVSGFFIGRIGRSLKKKSKQAQTRMGTLLSMIEETLTGLRIIKAFNAEDKVNERFVKENSLYTRIMIKMWRRTDLAGPLSEFLATVSIVILMWYGGSQILNGSIEMQPQTFIAFLMIFSQIITPVKAITKAYYNIQKGIASIDRIDGILDAEETIVNKPDALAINSFNESVEYDNISFKYIDDYVLKNVQIKLEKGKTIALVGQSGSGKSTLVDLLPRFYDINEGAIKIDGKNIKDYKLDNLRSLMGIVNQESILFNDTIYNNIAFGVSNATEEAIIAAAKVANAHNFILETPNGYQTNIGDRGDRLSGGQRQRISIARAVLANPPILILDEATSALDTESERLVQDALTNLMKNRTSIVIAHRLSTIVNVDEIYVMHEGKVVEQGTHKQLSEKNGVYKKLLDMQMFA